MSNTESEELKLLIRKRGSIKGRLTLFDKYVKLFESQQADVEVVDRVVVLELEQRMRDAELLIINFDEIQNDIELSVDDMDSQFPERDQFYSKYYASTSLAKILFEKYTNTDNVSEVNSVSQNSVRSIADISDGIKLPEIKLPKFDGSFQMWLDFRDIFESLIHANPKINEIQKFHYLRASLIGSATQVIQSIEFCAANYGIAWNTLCERFNNTNLLIQNHINAVFNMNPIAVESASKIRDLSDNLFKHLNTLKQLGEPTEHWDTLIIYVMSSKLDNNTSREWERLRAKQRNACTLDFFKQYLRERADLLENMEMNLDKSKHERVTETRTNTRDNRHFNRENKPSSFNSRTLYGNSEQSDLASSSNTLKSKYTCFLCKKSHSLFYCPEFLTLSVNDRIAKVKELHLCNNCLRPNHSTRECNWTGCKLCGFKHNTILHIAKEKPTSSSTAHAQSEHNNMLTQQNSSCNLSASENALLCTAIVQVQNSNGNFINARVLLDSASQSSYMTYELDKKLNLQKTKTNLTISGINGKVSHATEKCSIKIRSTTNTYHFDLTCFVLDIITNNLPDTLINRELLNIPSHIQLADPTFEHPQKIDILIGAEAFWNLLSDGKLLLGKNGPIMQNTHLGWVIAGPLDAYNYSAPKKTRCNLSKNVMLHDQLSKFWEVEEISQLNPWSVEETLCEKHFVENLKLSPDGRYIVSFPFKDSPSKLGNSRETAIKRLVNLERKLHSNETLRKMYSDFLREYEELGHMSEIQTKTFDNKPDYYLPHHGVLRESSSTTKLRVVFDGSSPSSNGVSLNNLQMVGPVIQSDLISIILRFRMRPFVLSGDIRMMYRQILINPEQRCLQKIVWRSNPNETIKTYHLNTITYGTTSGSFLAIRSLHEVANECSDEYPEIAKIIKNDMYVDDLLTSVNSLEEATFITNKLPEILLKRGFEMRKWKSNSCDILENLKNEQSENIIEFSDNKDNNSKILGLLWSSNQDILTYKISVQNEINTHKITKRVMLSRIASIFDPLGLASPCIIIAKVLMQKLWAENLTWDQPLPKHILNSWLEFSSELNILNTIHIDRKVICNQPTFISLQGFSDASESSYGACIYVLSKNLNNDTFCNLLCSKSKVAPLKTLTMPRLELCAALLLAHLVAKILDVTDIKFDQVTCWSDSTIVLGWLQASPSLLKPFVNNRVAEIQKYSFKWRHVPTKDNPADLVSRGVRPIHIIHSDMWWHGPKWLLGDQNDWPINQITNKDLPEIRNFSFVSTSPKTYFPFERFSSLIRLKRTAAYIFRFIENCRKKSAKRIDSHLTVSELNISFKKILKMAQMESFPEDYHILKNKRDLRSNSNILSLHPFLDDEGLIRVGGRLSNSDYSYSKKYPILLFPHHYLTKLIVKFEHENLLHAGPQLLLSHLRDTFWPISGRNLVRKIIRDCVKCARYDSHNYQPIMGDLPVSRVQAALPFHKTGVDYSGPYLMKDRRGRGCKVIKCWVAVFVCFSTRAIHLEMVLSLSSEDFLQAFHRFISRRGKPLEVFSDNGTNFTKSNKEIQLMGKFLQENSLTISESIANIGIKWHFIPANSPHFGGIWEAGVKSLKHHLKRVLGSYTLFLFDFQTLLIRIEGVLNSRPICPLSSNPDDLSSLTPSHFLIGRSALNILEPSVSHLPENRLSQFQLLQKIHEQFWNRWHHEYISEMQLRHKWKRTTGSLNVGQLVLIKDNNVPPMRWRLGRVVDLISGKDGICRVASLKTQDGVISRAVARLCPLPVESQPFQGGGHVQYSPGTGPEGEGRAQSGVRPSLKPEVARSCE